MAIAIKAAQAVSIDEYIAGFPKEVQDILEKLRVTISKAAPEAKETDARKERWTGGSLVMCVSRRS